MALCLFTLQMALMSHCSNRQGFLHSLWMQAWLSGHSSSLLQPAKQIKKWETVNLWLMDSNYKVLTFITDSIRVSLIPWFACTDCSMFINPAFSIDSTWKVETGILTLFADTCKVVWTFWVSNTFWPRCWKSCHVLQNN